MFLLLKIILCKVLYVDYFVIPYKNVLTKQTKKCGTSFFGNYVHQELSPSNEFPYFYFFRTTDWLNAFMMVGWFLISLIVWNFNSSVAREAQQMFQMASYLCMYLTLILSFFRNRDYTRVNRIRYHVKSFFFFLNKT